MDDPRLKLELTLRPGTIFLGSGGVEKWVSLVSGHCLTQDTVGLKPRLRSDGMYFDAGDWLTAADFSVSNVGTGDFTIAAWINLASLSHDSSIFNRITTFSSSMAYYFRILSTGTVDFFGGNSAAIAISSAVGVISVNSWAYVAVVRYNGVTSIYVNGAQSGSTHTGSVSISSASPLDVGAFSRTSHFFEGRLTDLVFYDTAKYTANFIPPPRSQYATPTPPPPPVSAFATALVNQFDSGD